MPETPQHRFTPLLSRETLLARLRAWWPYLLIFVFGLAAYANTIGNQFTFDDQIIVVKNPRIRQLTQLADIFGTSYWNSPDKGAEYRPITILSYAATYKLNQLLHGRYDGLRASTYHLGNVLLHALASALAAWAVMALFRRKLLAFLTGLFFALHPIHTEAVAGVVGRAEIMAAIGFFLALGAWASLKDARGRREIAVWTAVAGAGLFFGLFSKENTLTLGGVILLELLVVLRLRQMQKQPVDLKPLLRRLAPAAIALLAVVGLYFAARISVLGAITRAEAASYGFIDNPAFNAPTLARIATAIRTQGEYFWLLVWPENLIADFSYDAYPLSHSLMEPAVLVGAIALGALVLAVIVGLFEGPVVAFAAGFYLLTMSITSNIPFPIGTIKAERLVYLPSTAFCLLLALILERMWVRFPRIEVRALVVIAATTVSVGYFARTVQRNPVWENDSTLFAATVQSVPRNVKAHNNLGNSLAAEGRYDEALRHIDMALQIEPDSNYALANRAAITARKSEKLALESERLAKRGRTDEAMAMRQSARLLDQSALKYFQETVKKDPYFVPGLHAYGVFLCLKGNYDRGLDYLIKAHQLAPLDLDNLRQLVKFNWWSAKDTETRVERLQSAVKYGKAILDIYPADREAMVNVGVSHFELDEYEQAVPYLERSLEIVPVDVKTWNILGGAYYHLNKLSEAERAFRQALAVHPDDDEAADGLAKVLEAQKTGQRKYLRTSATPALDTQEN